MVKKFKKAEWFLEIIQKDLGKLSKDGLKKIAGQVCNVLYVTKFSMLSLIDEPSDDELMKIALSKEAKSKELDKISNALPEVQEVLRVALNNIQSTIKAIRLEEKLGEPPYWKEIATTEGVLKSSCVLEGPGWPDRPDATVALEELERINDVIGILSNIGTKDQHSSKTTDERKILWLYDFKGSLTQEMLLHFYQSLHELPSGAFFQCKDPGCRKWFINTSKRKKMYCSNNCAARFKTRENRKNLENSDPEKHKKELEAGAKRARKSYVKKAQKGNPNIKVAGRPIKYKKEE